MSYSPWDWADSFRLSEAACLIAGVSVESKWKQTLDEIPIDALPVFRQIVKAVVLGASQLKKPDDPKYPKERMLRTLWPEFPQSLPHKEDLKAGAETEAIERPLSREELHELTGWKVGRDELCRWVKAMGFKSAYQFMPSGSADHAAPVGESLAKKRGSSSGFPQSESGGKPSINWRHQIQAEAYEHWLRLRASGCNPSVYSICDDLAKWCVNNSIKGDKGQDPKAGTIRNSVLGAGHWTPPSHSVEQAKKHIAQTAQTKIAQTAQ